MEGTNVRWLAVLTAVSLAGLVFASTAGADSVSASNAAVAISASLMNGSNGATATSGDTVSAAASVTNLVDANAYVRIYLIADWDHAWSPNMNKLRKLKDGDTWDVQGQFKPSAAFTPPGIYHLTLITVSPGIIDPLVAQPSILVL
jgi:poly(3-hydroxybutyrate) depolymerase